MQVVNLYGRDVATGGELRSWETRYIIHKAKRADKRFFSGRTPQSALLCYLI